MARRFPSSLRRSLRQQYISSFLRLFNLIKIVSLSVVSDPKAILKFNISFDLWSSGNNGYILNLVFESSIVVLIVALCTVLINVLLYICVFPYKANIHDLFAKPYMPVAR